MKQETVELLGVKVNIGLQKEDVLSLLERQIKEGSKFYVCTTNPEFVMDAQKDSEFKEIINESYLSVVDGAGIVFGARFVHLMASEKSASVFNGIKNGFKALFPVSGMSVSKVPGVDLVDSICSEASKNGATVFFLGGWPKDFWGRMQKNVDYDLATKTAEVLKQKYTNLRVVGSTSQYSWKSSDDEAIKNYVKNCMEEQGINEIDYMFVAYGHKKQEMWIKRNLATLDVKCMLGVGGTFDYLSGMTKRPGPVVRKLNLEWLFRLITQPWRFRRIVKAFPLFPLRMYFVTVFQSNRD